MLRYLCLQSIGFLLLSTLCRFAIEVGLSKQAATSAFMKDYSSWIANIASNLPMLVLILLAFWLYKATNCSFFDWPWKYVILGTILCYMLIIVHWVTDRDGFGVALMPESIGKSYIPRIVYAISLGQLLLLAYGQLFKRNSLDCKTKLVTKTTTMLSAWSSTVILLSGKQGPIIAVASIVGGALYFYAHMLYTKSLYLFLQTLIWHGFVYAVNTCRLALVFIIWLYFHELKKKYVSVDEFTFQVIVL